MVIEHYSGGGSGSASSLVDVLDRVLDKGIVIDAWVRVSLVGIDLLSVEARVVVASIDTYLRYAEAIGLSTPVARAGMTPPADQYSVGAGAEPLTSDMAQGAQPRTRTGPRGRQGE